MNFLKQLCSCGPVLITNVAQAGNLAGEVRLKKDKLSLRRATGGTMTTGTFSAIARLPVAQARIGIPAILACHSRGPVWWTEVPFESTATVTGMSFTSNS